LEAVREALQMLLRIATTVAHLEQYLLPCITTDWKLFRPVNCTLDSLPKSFTSRTNPSHGTHGLAKFFYRRGFIETWGRGTLQIVKLMQDAGLTAPHVQVGADTVSITFALPTQPKQEKSSEKILELLKRQPAMSPNALTEKMNISSRAVEKQIGLLKKNGKLRRIGPSKGGRWNVES
jgi:predicted HTH transcriptional regulator